MAPRGNVDVVILTALQDELDAVLAIGEGWRERADRSGFPYHVREIARGEGDAPLTVAAAWLGKMGETVAAMRGAALLSELDPACVAMCGICAGLRGAVALGDVIVADSIYSYDHGKLIAVPGEDIDFRHDVRTYNLHPLWSMRAASLGREIDLAGLQKARPLSKEAEQTWLLHVQYAHEEEGGPSPAAHPARKSACPRYSERLREAVRDKLLLLKDGELALTKTGREVVRNDRAIYPDELPKDADLRVHVGAVATGKAVREDPDLFPRLRRIVRTTIGVEMEGAAIGSLVEHFDKRGIVVKAVSDHADLDKDDSFRKFACRASAEVLMAFLGKHLVARTDARAEGRAGGAEPLDMPSPVAIRRPSYKDLAKQALGEQLAAARERRERLRQRGLPTGEVDGEILNLRRQLRAGGQLNEGDALGDGRYLLVRRLGKGGFAVVWEAHDEERGVRVAIKVLHPELARDSSRLERFFRGAREMAEIEHEAVVRVLEPRGEDDGWHYFVMEFVPGGDLRQAVLAGRLGEGEILRIVLGVGEALIAAHAKGLIHRDVKPANILLDASGAPRLTDFDLVAANDTTGGTRTGAMGTFLYAAPEMLDRPQDADARADVFGLAMTATFALYGKDLPATMLRRADPVIDGLGCAAHVKAALKRALEWDRDSRFESVRAFCDAMGKDVTNERVTEVASVLMAGDRGHASEHGGSAAKIALEIASRTESSAEFARLLAGKALKGLDLSGRDLREADLTGADLRGATLTNASLTRADLRSARLERADLRRAHLGDADLRGADLSLAKLLGADLRGARLEGAILRGAELVGAMGVEVSGLAAIGAAHGGVEASWSAAASACFAVAWSPTGDVVASGHEDGSVRAWDTASGRAIRVFRGHTGSVRCVGWSPDGQTLASGSYDKTVRLWDVTTGRNLRAFEGHTDLVSCVAWSPDGQTLASGSYDKTVHLWKLATGRAMRIFEGHTNKVWSVAWSADGQTIASGSYDATVRLWEVATGHVLRVFEGHKDAVRSIAWSPDGQTLASASDDKTVRLWEVATGLALRAFKGHKDAVWKVAWSPDGQTLASGSYDKTVRLWEVATGRTLRAFEGHTNSVFSVAWSPDGQTLASGSYDKTVRLWEVATGRTLRAFQGHTNLVLSVAWSPDGQTLASWSANKMRLRHVVTGRDVRTFQDHANKVWSVAWSPDGQTLASGSADSTMRLWDVATGRHVRAFQGHTNAVFSVAWSSDGRVIASGSDDKTVRLWDVATGRALRAFEGHTNRVWSVAWSPNGQSLASASSDNTVRLWDVATGRELNTFQGHTNWVLSVAWSPDSQSLASGSSDNKVRLWDVATGRALRTFEGHTNAVNSVALSPDGQTLASASDDATIRLWDVATARCLAILLATLDGWAAFTPDGRYKLDGNLAGSFWHVVGLCRFEPGELDPYLPSPLRIPDDVPFRSLPPAEPTSE